MAHVFISYSTHNGLYALRVADKLRAEGFDVWIDNARLRSSDNWWENIVLALRSCSAVVVIMTPESRLSKWVQREVTLADNWGKPIFPLLLLGENWEIFVLTQFSDVRTGMLPGKSFYDDVGLKAPRHADNGEDVTETVITRDEGVESEVKQAIADPPPQDKELEAPRRPVGVGQVPPANGLSATPTKEIGLETHSFTWFIMPFLLVALAVLILLLQSLQSVSPSVTETPTTTQTSTSAPLTLTPDYTPVGGSN